MLVSTLTYKIDNLNVCNFLTFNIVIVIILHCFESTTEYWSDFSFLSLKCQTKSKFNKCGVLQGVNLMEHVAYLIQ